MNTNFGLSSRVADPQAAKSFPLRKTAPLPIAATKAVAPKYSPGSILPSSQFKPDQLKLITDYIMAIPK